ncbi:MAG: tetratricopeptide repeat protein, partial [Muribaculaceae bacterium]|nr:tetratricopeptide repeat protein [Muribaculaceae bacterium]
MYLGLANPLRRMAALTMSIVAVAAVLMLSACSAKKNTAGNRRYQEFITRYNIYYNGNTHYIETLEEMEKNYEDDYSKLLYMHPVEAKADKNATQPSGNFDRSIEKAQNAFQLRSIKKKPARKPGKSKDPAYKEWMKREEYNPFLHNAWMMLGRGQYYNGDFLGAASTFFYTSRHFSWLPGTVTEAKLMQALSYIAMGWQFEAEMILSRIKAEDLTNNRLRRLYNFAYADFYVHAGDYEEALPFMIEAVKGAKKEQKTRLNFLLGQLYQRLGQNENAYKAFAAAGSSSSTSYRTKFNARIKQSEVYSGSDIEPEVKALKRMTRYDRNKEYLDQIYYAIGNLYLSRGDTLRAIENYEIANEKSTRNGIDKAINQLRLGELYFMRGNYEKAQPSYSEAVPQLPESYPDYALIKRRSDVLDELAVYSQNVNLQDSLLRLAAMTPEERLKVIDRIIEELKEKEKKEQEDAAREEFLANQAAQGGGLQDQNSQSFTINSDNSWYFYNTATKNAGKTDFQKRWGSRKLEDDWRRRNKASFNADDFDVQADGDSGAAAGADDVDDNQSEGGGQDEEKDSNEPDKSSDPHYPEYYLAQIPSTETEIANSHDVIQEGLYNMGVILKDKLDDFDASASEFGRLLADYPDNIYRLDTYYNLYLMYMRMGDTAKAEQYRQMILRDFAESKYGMALRDPDYIGTLRSMDARMQELYENTYEAYLDNRNAEVHRAYEYV